MTPLNTNSLKRGSSRGISFSGHCTGKSVVKPTLASLHTQQTPCEHEARDGKMCCNGALKKERTKERKQKAKKVHADERARYGDDSKATSSFQ